MPGLEDIDGEESNGIDVYNSEEEFIADVGAVTGDTDGQ